MSAHQGHADEAGGCTCCGTGCLILASVAAVAGLALAVVRRRLR